MILRRCGASSVVRHSSVARARRTAETFEHRRERVDTLHVSQAELIARECSARRIARDFPWSLYPTLGRSFQDALLRRTFPDVARSSAVQLREGTFALEIEATCLRR